MAVNTKTAILPIMVQGLYTIKPKIRWSIKPGTVKVIIKKPVAALNKTVEELLAEVESMYVK